MGLKFTDFQRNIGHYIPNATQCNTWTDVKASHRNKDNLVILNYDDIYGLLIVLALGVSSSCIIFIAEVVINMTMKCQK